MSDYLIHYGVKGMKWGVRRYQNKDGTLTNAGKKRYSEEDSEKKNRLSTKQKAVIGATCVATVLAVYGGYSYASYKSATIQAGRDAVIAYEKKFRLDTISMLSARERRLHLKDSETKIFDAMKKKLESIEANATFDYHKTYDESYRKYRKNQDLKTIINTIRNQKNEKQFPNVDEYLEVFSNKNILKEIAEADAIIDIAKKTGRSTAEVAREFAFEELKKAFSEPIV